MIHNHKLELNWRESSDVVWLLILQRSVLHSPSSPWNGHILIFFMVYPMATTRTSLCATGIVHGFWNMAWPRLLNPSLKENTPVFLTMQLSCTLCKQIEDELTCYDTQANIQTQECMTIVVPVETLDISVSLCVVSGMNTECVNCCHQVHFNIFISKGVIYRLTFQR